MSSPTLEGFLARLYTDQSTLSEFLRRPAEIARAAGLSDAEVMALEGADHVGLVMAARSCHAKRQQRRNHRALSRLFPGGTDNRQRQASAGRRYPTALSRAGELC